MLNLCFPKGVIIAKNTGTQGNIDLIAATILSGNLGIDE